MEKINMNRRKFVTALGLGTAHVLFSNPLFAASPGRFSSNNPTQEKAYSGWKDFMNKNPKRVK